MSSQAITFISFRRIRYSEASLAYRDLMFSGAVPWLSDHCIDAELALSLRDAPDTLGTVLTERIASCDCALVLADEGYFSSAWTRLEFEHLMTSHVPTVVVRLNDAVIPAEFTGRMTGTTQVHDDVETGLLALCKTLGTTLAPFAGRPLYRSNQASTFGLRFEMPEFLSGPDVLRFADTASEPRSITESRNPLGDSVQFRVTPIQSGPASQIVSLLREDPGTSEQRLYDLYEDELWHHVHRLNSQCGRDLRLVGYHKLRVPRLNVTAVGLSLCARASGGFFRFASVPLVSTGSRLQMVCFVRGSLQRFHALVPEIDSMILTMDGGRTPFRERWQLGMQSTAGSGYVAQDFLWMRCKHCGHRLTAPALSAGCCGHCGFQHAECLTVTCPNRKCMTVAQLATAVQQELRLPHTQQERAISPESANLLCDGCCSSLFIPGHWVTDVQGPPDRSFPVILHPRFTIVSLWPMLVAIGLIWNGGGVYRWILGLLGGFITFEPIALRRLPPRDPSGWRGGMLHIGRSLALVCCLSWIAAHSDDVGGLSLPLESRDILRSPGMLALGGTFALFVLVAYAAITPPRDREYHLRCAAVYAAVYALVEMWCFEVNDQGWKAASVLLVSSSGAMALSAVTMLNRARVERPEAEMLWDSYSATREGERT